MTISSPANGGSFFLGQSAPTSFACAEGGGPGLESCTDSNGSATGTGVLDTSTLGTHTYSVTAISEDGEKGEASITYTVVPATSPSTPGSSTSPTPGAPSPSPVPPEPSVRISHSPNHPHVPNPKGGSRYTFHFSDQVAGATFLCSIDAKPFKPCSSPTVYRNLKRGRHVFAVKSVVGGVESTVRRVVFRAGSRRTKHS